MKIIIHQSLCGEINKAWGLLKTTLPDSNVARSVAFKADLHEQTGDIYWTPAIRGFSDGDYFLIMRTFEDTSLEVRRGRKYSHVLIIYKDDIRKVENIEPIINLLHKTIDKNAAIEPITLNLTSQNQISNIPLYIEGRFNSLVHGYVNIKDYENTLVWVGQEDFDLVVIELWKRLNESERQSFNFDISFNSENKRTDGISLNTIPESIQSKFIKTSFYIVGKNDFYQPIELIEQLSIGNPSAQHRISTFEKVIGSKTLTRDEIKFVAKGIDTFEQLEATLDIKKISTLSHIISQYAPSNTQGVDYKSRLLERVVQLMDKAKFSDLVVLRTFKVDSYSGSKQRLSNALVKWIKTNIFSIEQHSTDFKLFFDNVRVTNLNWWDQIVVDELRSYLDPINIKRVSVIYIWITETPSILNKISPFIDKTYESEICFLKKIPQKISNALIEELKTLSISNNWFQMYAQLLLLQLQWEDALTELLQADQDENRFDGIEIILNNKDQKSIIDYAVKTGNSRMLKKAGEICHKLPIFLNAVDVANINWQKIWLEAIKQGNEVDAGVNEPRTEIFKILDLLISGNEISEELLRIISKSEFGDILSYPNRLALWEHLPDDIKKDFLSKSSAALLEQLSKKSTTTIPQDAILADHITQKGISDFLYFNRNNIRSVIQVFETFPKLYDDNLRDYLNNFSGSIDAVDATHLGKIVARKSYTNSAYAINSRASKHNNWRFALAECYHLLNFVTKGLLAISGTISNVYITDEQWWQSAEELIIELYPNGTSLTTIWKKSGGKESELIMNATPGGVWSDVLYKLRKKHFKDITMNDLLKEIKKDYGDNQKFKIIYELRKKFIKMN